MRIIIMADSHGGSDAVMKIIQRNIYTADMFIHLGDGEDDTLGALQEYPDINLIQIRGNCDRKSDLPSSKIIETVQGQDDNKIRIIAVHGHLHGADHGTDELISLAKEKNCDIVLFAHTHRRFDRTENGIMLINPGSCVQPRDGDPPSYAYLDITPWGMIKGIVDLLD